MYEAQDMSSGKDYALKVRQMQLLTFIAVIYALLSPNISRYSNKSANMQRLVSSLDTTPF